MNNAEGTVLEVFIPGPGENPEDRDDMERSFFLGVAQEALDSGVDIEVYSTDTYPSAFELCEPVADQIAMSGIEVLPLMLVNGEVKVSYMYPTAEQIKRFSKAHTVKQPKANAAAAACGPGGAAVESSPVPSLQPAGFAATLADRANAAVGPAIGNRINLMGGDTGDGIPTSGSVATKGGGGCGCGGCGCGSK
ncbi:MAG: arsenic metallochaperone ArsD family protein [Rothia sp. (in: high G+C Gram-positive bacteria)]|uniref:arsenic metallochaperone ArsD family protein n=1 Tax=Rothia sp. (in: high G+C Gram-positive bacteria) TaxID=1885016 RepID=UPI0026DF2DA3|nr:arsenic metallochaperone ArsD family protein [Rothia sp. (in: high G+C Gram-positive bacteria)]MDO5749691.1 arsenic metallochaperone ArsD family protein [Rothia sp. (in: high G+C Gram-positive bacteria)]